LNICSVFSISFYWINVKGPSYCFLFELGLPGNKDRKISWEKNSKTFKQLNIKTDNDKRCWMKQFQIRWLARQKKCQDMLSVGFLFLTFLFRCCWAGFFDFFSFVKIESKIQMSTADCFRDLTLTLFQQHLFILQIEMKRKKQNFFRLLKRVWVKFIWS